MPVLRVVGPVGEELQRQERMRRPALAKVELDRVRVPAALAANGDEVDREAADHALTRQPLADLRRLPRDRGGVGGIGREATAEVALPARAAEQLVVRREHLERAERRHPHLDARAAELLAGDSLLDDPAALGEISGVCGRSRRSGTSNAIDRTRSSTAARSPAVPGAGQAGADRRSRFPPRRRPRSASRSRAHRRVARLAAAHAPSTTSAIPCSSSNPRADAARPAPRTADGNPSWCRSGRTSDRPRTWGCPSASARSRSSSVVLKGTRCARSGRRSARGCAGRDVAARAASPTAVATSRRAARRGRGAFARATGSPRASRSR